ncbi:MAG: GNAT family N-acetyltransferase [Chloroflexota bacterium]|nr:GNAT family N-acetyltransferase [Chloroflexota bacterium]
MIEYKRLTGADVQQHEDSLMELLRDSVAHGASVGFLPPLDEAINRRYWAKVARDVEAGERVLIIAQRDGQVVGTAQLGLAMYPNGRHRAEVQKVLVHSTQRRQGIGQALMVQIEQEARALGRTLLVLDTLVDGGAEALYERTGYMRLGVIPQFALHEGVLCGTVVYYKVLSS